MLKIQTKIQTWYFALTGYIASMIQQKEYKTFIHRREIQKSGYVEMDE